MKQGRISQTALKVANSLITLNVKDDWAERLPAGLVELSERLLLASGSPGYGPWVMEMSKKPWMIRVWQLQDALLIPGQFEGFGHRKIFMQEQVEAAIKQGARQVLLVGAGFDTLCLRLAPQHSQVQSRSTIPPRLRRRPKESPSRVNRRTCTRSRPAAVGPSCVSACAEILGAAREPVSQQVS